MTRHTYVAIGIALLAGSAELAKADLLAYETTTSGQFGTIDLNTGVTTVITTGIPPSAGLGEINGILYSAGGRGDHTLFTVNPVNGDFTPVGNGIITYTAFGSTTTGLFGVDTYDRLWSINPSTGASTLIGPDGIGNGCTLSSSSGTLFCASFEYASLYTLNTFTGEGTVVGSYDTSTLTVEAMVFEGGSLYAGGQRGGVGFQLNTIDTATGQATPVAKETGLLLGFAGLAPAVSAAVPEPGYWGLLGLAIAGLAWLQRRHASR
jgi:hypothetical protein